MVRHPVRSCGHWRPAATDAPRTAATTALRTVAPHTVACFPYRRATRMSRRDSRPPRRSCSAHRPGLSHAALLRARGLGPDDAEGSHPWRAWVRQHHAHSRRTTVASGVPSRRAAMANRDGARHQEQRHQRCRHAMIDSRRHKTPRAHRLSARAPKGTANPQPPMKMARTPPMRRRRTEASLKSRSHAV